MKKITGWLINSLFILLIASVVPTSALAQEDNGFELCDEIEVGDFCSQTQGGWGSRCSGENVGCLRDAHFDTVYPSGLVVGGNKTIALNSSSAVQDYLPAGGSPASLSNNHVDPSSTEAGILGGQVVALQLNVDFSAAGFFDQADPTPLGDLVIVSGKFAGMSVSAFLALANDVLGGDTSSLSGFSASISDVNDTAASINENFVDCDTDNGYLTKSDRDEDGHFDECDNCPDNPNEDQTDTDEDGFGDACEECPEDANKVIPGQCGCGEPETGDADEDGIFDCIDECPESPKAEPGVCGCDVQDTDTDEDGVADCIDNCVEEPNPDQENSDTDSQGDACDNCTDVFNPGQEDENNFDDGARDGDACEVILGTIGGDGPSNTCASSLVAHHGGSASNGFIATNVVLLLIPTLLGLALRRRLSGIHTQR